MISVVERHTVWDAHIVMSETPLSMENAEHRKTQNYVVGAVN